MDPVILIILAVGVIGLFWINTRSRKQQQQRLAFRDTLQPGQEVQTIGGLIGTVTAVAGDEVTIETTPGNEVRFVRAAIAKLVEPTEDEADEADETDVDTAVDTPAGEQDRPSGFLSQDEMKKPYRDGDSA